MSALNITIQTLLAEDDVTDVAADRIFPIFYPQAAGLPGIVVRLIAENDPDNLGGAWKRPESRVSIECRAEGGRVDQLYALAEAVINAMQDKTEYPIASCIATIRKEGTDESDSSEQVTAHGYPEVIRRIIDFYVVWRRAP